DANVTVPTAPSLNTTVSFAISGLNPVPLIVIVPAFAFRVAVLIVTTGPAAATEATVATCTGEPLLTPLVVTTAVNAPAVVGGVVKCTLSEVVVDEVTAPTAPLLNVTRLLPAVGSKP